MNKCYTHRPNLGFLLLFTAIVALLVALTSCHGSESYIAARPAPAATPDLRTPNADVPAAQIEHIPAPTPTPTPATGPISTLTKSQLLKKTSTELRVLLEEGYNEVKILNVKLSSGNTLLDEVRVQLAKTHDEFNRVLAWGTDENARANSASAEYWKAKEKLDKVLRKLYLYKGALALVIGGFVFLITLRFTQYMAPPWCIVVPIGFGIGAATAVFVFL